MLLRKCAFYLLLFNLVPNTLASVLSRNGDENLNLDFNLNSDSNLNSIQNNKDQNDVQLVQNKNQEHHTDNSENVSSLTIIDLLSGDPRFSSLLVHLQSEGLIELLNNQNNITFIAPLNIKDDSHKSYNENIKKHSIFKYLILPSVTYSYDVNFDSEGGSVLNTEYFTDDAHLSIPILAQNIKENNTFYLGNNQVLKSDWKASNGIIHIIENFPVLPLASCKFIDDNLTHFRSFFQLFFSFYKCSHISNTTILLPHPDAFTKMFSVLQLKYLLSEYGLNDALTIVNSAIFPGRIYLQDLLDSKSNYHNLNNQVFSFSNKNGKLLLNSDLQSTSTNLITQDNVFYSLSNLLLDPNSINFTPLKYLYALDAIEFANMIAYLGLLGFLNDSSIDQTIIAPLDGQQELYDNDGGVLFSNLLSAKYHFIDGHINLDQDYLVESRMVSRKLGRHHQKIKITKDKKTGEVYFNDDSMLIKDPVNVGNTTILIVDTDITPPSSLKSKIGSVLDGTISFSYLKNLDSYRDLPKGSTIFLPNDASWSKKNLLRKFLLQNTTALELVLNSLILDGLFYSTSKPNEFITQAGNNISLSYDDSLGDFYLNDTRLHSSSKDMLISTGVVHLIDGIPIPSDLKISYYDLLKAAGSSLFLEFMKDCNLTNILDDGAPYTILVPTDAALLFDNISTNISYLDTLLKLHIIKTEANEDILDGNTYSTFESGLSLSASSISSSLYVFFIDGILPGSASRSHQVRVLHHGWTSNGGRILIVDKEIIPDWMVSKDPKAIRTWIAIGIGIITGIVLLFVIISILFCCVFVRPEPYNPEYDPLLANTEEEGNYDDYGNNGNNGQENLRQNNNPPPIVVS